VHEQRRATNEGCLAKSKERKTAECDLNQTPIRSVEKKISKKVEEKRERYPQKARGGVG